MTDLLSEIFNRKYGVVAVERGKVLGYLSFWGGNNGQFGNIKGSFSLLFANGYAGEDRGKIVSLLFQYASEEMIKEEILSYAICIYSHDAEIISALTMNGFGMRCSDAARNVGKPLDIQINTDYFTIQEVNMKRLITEALRHQFDSTFHMARVLVKVCPKEIWVESYNNVPFWQQVFHYVYFIDFWMREKYEDSEWRTMIFDDAYTTDLYADSYKGLFISQDKMLEYLDAIQLKTTCVFDSLNDEKLSDSVWKNYQQHTYIDVIVGQIRHIMYNIGYLNGIMRELGLPESDWYAYNEPEGS